MGSKKRRLTENQKKALIKILEKHPNFSPRQLAKRFNVSRPSIIKALEDVADKRKKKRPRKTPSLLESGKSSVVIEPHTMDEKNPHQLKPMQYKYQ